MIIHGDHIHPPRRRLKLSALPCLASLDDLYRACGSSMSFKHSATGNEAGASATSPSRQRTRRPRARQPDKRVRGDALKPEQRAHATGHCPSKFPNPQTCKRPARARSKRQHRSSVPEDMDSASSTELQRKCRKSYTTVELHIALAHSLM